MKPIALYSLCTACDGHGRLPVYLFGPRTELCRMCFGKGSPVTEDGRSIIDLLGVVGLDELLPDD